MVIGKTAATSGQPTWPNRVTAPQGAPNVVVILTDDVGFGSSSTFGGLVPTPNYDALAKNGARYNQFNTAAFCSPTRAALLTGRDPHNVNMGNVSNIPTAYKGYNSVIPKSAGMVSDVLRLNGYNTAAFGKWHLTPEWDQTEFGPFDRWPTGQGFEYWYGFIGGDTDQFAPSLYENTRAVAPPTNDPSYILDRDLADHAIRWIKHHQQIEPNRPFFIYYAPGSAHAPNSAPKEWLAKFRGKFDQGWDVARQQIFRRQKKMGIIPADTKLTPRPDFFPAWNSLSADRRKVYARYMEAFAAQLAYSDDQIGRVIAELRTSGQMDNTLIVFVQGDNGASAEAGLQGVMDEESVTNNNTEDFAEVLKRIDDIGGPRAQNVYPSMWAWAMGTPFQYYKQVASHFGGIRNGLVVNWPGHIEKSNVVRSQFLDVSDVMPTVLEAAGIQMPAAINGITQQPMDGSSFLYSFKNPSEPSPRHLKAYEMLQNLGVYKDGWWAGTKPIAGPWDIMKPANGALESRQWELYHVSEDYSQAKNLASVYPDKLRELQDDFFAEAGKNNILPIHNNKEGSEGRPTVSNGRSQFVFQSGMTRLLGTAAPSTIGRSYSFAADVVLPSTPANGVLVTQGGRFGGYAFYMKDGVVVFDYNTPAIKHFVIRSKEAVAPGEHTIAAEFTSDTATPGSPGTLRLLVDGKEVSSGRIDRTQTSTILDSEGFAVGEDVLTPVNDDYDISGSKFTGELIRLLVELK